MNDAFYLIAIGGNIGDSRAILSSALAAIKPAKVSSLYRSSAFGAATQPFLNAVMVLPSQLKPEHMLDYLQDIENQHGRTREIRWGDRTLDLDILWWSEGEYRSPRLEIPHPGFLQRDFMLIPAAEVAPDLLLWGKGTTLSEYAKNSSPLVQTHISIVR
jgi:2-amino-4-hydroxy-6-hydroxymethyldihydropteridine diphosphokinase